MDSKLPYTLVGREPLRTINDLATNNLPATKVKPKPVTEFKWRAATGVMTPPRHLRTSHLFNIVSMIWNHAMPGDAMTHNYIRHDFGPFYSPEYMERGIKACLRELMTRSDMTPHMLARLEFMKDYLRRKRPSMAEELKITKPQKRLPDDT